MANQNIKLEKSIISSKTSNDLYSKNFNNIAKSDVEIDQSRISDIYDIVFYNTPKTGTYSHTSIVQRIFDYIHVPLNRTLDNKIETLSDSLIELNNELDNRQSPFEPQHPVYANGSFIIAGENGVKYDGLDTVYIMQEGLKRPIANTDIYKSIRKCFDQPYTGSAIFTGLYFVNLEEINTINEGARITTTDDLNITGINLDVEDTEITAYYSSYILELECVGNEIEDASDLLVIDPDAQFYLNGGCSIRYFEAGTEENRRSVFNPIRILGLNLNKGQKRIIRVGRNNDLQPTIDGVPPNASDYYTTPNVQYNGNTVQDYIKAWGEGTKYDGIVDITGRVKYKELGKDTKIYDNPGKQKILNGLPPNFLISPQIVGEELSIYGTRIIYPGGSDLYGDQQHESYLQNEVFNDPTSNYYKPEFYGQPIFRYDSDYLVLLGYEDTNLGNYIGFLSLEKQEDRVPTGLNAAYLGLATLGFALDSTPIRFYKKSKLKEEDPNDKHICPLPEEDSGKEFGWKDRDWNVKRLRYKGFKNTPAYGFKVDARNYERGGNKNPLQDGFIYPSYLFDNHPNQWTPWN